MLIVDLTCIMCVTGTATTVRTLQKPTHPPPLPPTSSASGTTCAEQTQSCNTSEMVSNSQSEDSASISVAHTSSKAKRRSMASPPPPPPRSRAESPSLQFQEKPQQNHIKLQKQSQIEVLFQREQDQVEIIEHQDQQIPKRGDEELQSLTHSPNEIPNEIKSYENSKKEPDERLPDKNDITDKLPEKSLQQLRQEIEKQLQHRYQQMQIQQQQDEAIALQQKQQLRTEESQKQKEQTGKSQGEQLRLELQMRLQQREQQRQEQEHHRHKNKHHKSGTVPPGSLPLKYGPPPVPRRKSSLSNPSTPICTSAASSRDVSRSPSPTLPPPPPPPPPRSQSSSRPSSRPTSRPPSRPVSRPTSPPPSPPSPNTIKMNKLKGLPKVIPPGVPPTLKKSPLSASLTQETSEVISGKIQNQILSNACTDSAIKSASAMGTNFLTKADSQIKSSTYKCIDLNQKERPHLEPENSNSMSISWPIQQVPKDSVSPATQMGEFVKISTQKDGSYNSQIGNHYSNNYASLGISQAFDPANRSLSPANNSFTQSNMSSSENLSTFRSFSPLSFNISTEPTYCQPNQAIVSNQMNQLGSSGSSTFKSNPGSAQRVYGSNQDISHDYLGHYKRYEGINNIKDGRKTIGYFKNTSKSGSADLRSVESSSETNNLFSIVTSGTNDLIGSLASIEANDGKDLSIRSLNFNITEQTITDLNLQDMNIKENSDMNIEDMNIALDSSSDNGNENVALDLDQTSDSIQADVGESVDSIGGAPCRNPTCSRGGDAEDALVKTCHNCGTVYCSRVCRRSHWEKHKKLCQKIRANNAAKEIVAMVRDKEISLDAASAVGRRGALGLGRGVVKMFFPDIPSAESFIEGNYTPSMHYHTAQNLMPNEMCPEVYRQLMEMCRIYNRDHKFILYVSICVNNEITSGPTKCKRENVSRAAKIRLFDPAKRVVTSKQPTTTFKDDILDAHPKPPKETGMRLLTFAPDTKDGNPGSINRQKTPTAPSMFKIPGFTDDENSVQGRDNDFLEAETLVLTPIEPLNVSDREARQIIFHNILRHLREKNILLRTQYPDVYRKLSIYADAGETFPPLTIHSKDSDTGATLVCVIMPEADQNKIRKLSSECMNLRKIDVTKPPKNPIDSRKC